MEYAQILQKGGRYFGKDEDVDGHDDSYETPY